MNKIRGWAMAALFVATAATGLFANVRAQNPTEYPCVSSGPDAAFRTHHCASLYDLGGTGDVLALQEDCALAGGLACTILFSDGNLDIGGVIYEGCYSPGHVGNSLPSSAKSVNRDWEDCFPPNSGWDAETAYITDAAFGSDIGGFYCVDLNGDGRCGSSADGEFGTGFCGDANFFVPNYAVAMVYLVDGPRLQPVDCPGTANPIGGTTGTVNIWILETTAPQCSDGVDNDGDGYTDWGYGPGWPDRAPNTSYPGNLGSGCTDIADDTE